MDRFITKEKAVFTSLLLLLIVVGEIIFEELHLPIWPAFMAMLFYFMSHMNIKEAPGILIGGFFGIFNLILIKLWIPASAAFLGGPLNAKLVYIVFFIGLIVLLMEVLPWLFNAYAFFYLLVSGLAVAVPEPVPNPYLWIGIELIGGGILIAGVYAARFLTAKVVKVDVSKIGEAQ